MTQDAATERSMCGICRQLIPAAELTIDHIRPRCRGGDNSPDNLQPAHRFCNEAKGRADRLFEDTTPTRWTAVLAGELQALRNRTVTEAFPSSQEEAFTRLAVAKLRASIAAAQEFAAHCEREIAAVRERCRHRNGRILDGRYVCADCGWEP